MYEEYYGFVRPPFSLSPDPRFLYRSASHDLALQQVWQAIRRNEGFIVLTGDIGTGKTTLCRTLLEQFEPATFTALVLNPFLDANELLREVLLGFGVVSRSAMKSGQLATATRNDLVRALHEFLVALVPLKGSAVLIIDEAQHLSADSLEEVRLLSNLELSDKKLLQIVIVGQLNLLDTLGLANLRQLDQRISIRCSLRALSRDETEAYVSHRLFVARCSRPVTFSAPALDVVQERSAGIPRVINLLCDRALMAGARDATTAIGPAHVERAAADLHLDAPAPAPDPVVPVPGPTFPVEVGAPVGMPEPRHRVWMAVAASLLAFGAAALWLLGNPLELFAASQPPQPPPVARPFVTPVATTPAAIPTGVAASSAPPLANGRFSILIGTYDTPPAVETVTALLQARDVPVYYVDITMLLGKRERRVLVGRYATRVDAEAVRATLAATMPEVRVIYGELERMRVP